MVLCIGELNDQYKLEITGISLQPAIADDSNDSQVSLNCRYHAIVSAKKMSAQKC